MNFNVQLILTDIRSYLSSIQGDRPFCCPMPNCRRRFATEPEVKKHIDNHMNPNTNKARRSINPSISVNLTNTIAAVAAAENSTKTAAAAFLGTAIDKQQNNLIPRMTAGTVKHELYFPQCYGPPFNQQSFTVAAGQQNGDSMGGSTTPATASIAVANGTVTTNTGTTVVASSTAAAVGMPSQ